MAVRVRGEFLGRLCYFSQLPSTLPSMHNFVIVEGCGMGALKLQ